MVAPRENEMTVIGDRNAEVISVVVASAGAEFGAVDQS